MAKVKKSTMIAIISIEVKFENNLKIIENFTRAL